MEETKKKKFKYIIQGAAIVLCIFFFTLPLVQCSQDNSLTASGLEIATGTGDLFSESDSGYHLAFLLLIVPVILIIAAFTGKSFAVLRNISITGLGAEIVFLIYAYAQMNSGDRKGVFEFTSFNWLVLAIYIGLYAFSHHCEKLE